MVSIGNRRCGWIFLSVMFPQTFLSVIDTKYKVSKTFSNTDYYQVIAYADAIDCNEALLVYPEDLASPMNLKPGKIRVRSLVFNLNKPIEEAGRVFLDKLYTILDGK